MNIFDGDLVLEVGSGDNPHPRADILSDRYLTRNHERAGGFRIQVDRPMVVADGMRLPFADKTFDYVIASHIFEHMDNPVGFAREIMRVGKAGFIEVPSALSERVFGWNFHHWYCRLEEGMLIFTPKKEGERFNGFFHRFIARELWFRRFFEEHEDAWYTRLFWQGRIPIEVRNRPMGRDEIQTLYENAWTLLENAKPEPWKDIVFTVRFFVRRALRKIRKTVRKILWQGNTTTEWMRYVVCPRCRGSLQIDREGMKCNTCNASYAIDGAIPVMLLPEEREKGY